MHMPIPNTDEHGRRRLVTALIPPVLVVSVLWIVFAFDRVYNLDLYRFGVYPREAKGLVGIVVSPFVHDDLEHLFNNSAPIMVLGWLLVYFYPKATGRVVLASWMLGGLWVWLTARDSYHIGASGIIYGMAAFLFFSGLLRRRIALMAVSLIVVFLYGSMVWGVLPIQPRISTDYDELLSQARQQILSRPLAHAGERVVVTAGVPFDVPGTTNQLKVETV